MLTGLYICIFDLPTGMAIRTRPLSISTQADTALFVHAASQMSVVSSGLVYVDNMPMRANFPPPDNTLPDPPGREMLHISRISDAVLNGGMHIRVHFLQIKWLLQSFIDIVLFFRMVVCWNNGVLGQTISIPNIGCKHQCSRQIRPS